MFLRYIVVPLYQLDMYRLTFSALYEPLGLWCNGTYIFISCQPFSQLKKLMALFGREWTCGADSISLGDEMLCMYSVCEDRRECTDCLDHQTNGVT